MPAPLVNLIVFVALCGMGLWVFLPNVGVLSMLSRGRRTAQRINTEDALKFLFHQEAGGQTTTLSALSASLQVEASTAMQIAERMRVSGLVIITDGRLVLTEEGTRYGLQVIRAHRLWERYLADETGVDPVEWHTRAEQREHLLTPDEADALEARLGNPRFDPHGDPIPTSDGTVTIEPTNVLTELSVGERALVIHVEDEPQVVYAQLVASGVHPGIPIRVVARTDDRIVLDSDGRELILAPIVAGNVSVRRVDLSDIVEVEAQGTLRDLSRGEKCEVVRISPACRGIERRRLMDLGIVSGTEIAYEKAGLSGGLTAYRVRGTVIAIREEQAEMISIIRTDEAANA